MCVCVCVLIYSVHTIYIRVISLHEPLVYKVSEGWLEGGREE